LEDHKSTTSCLADSSFDHFSIWWTEEEKIDEKLPAVGDQHKYHRFGDTH
jgi:hypothetical protein